MPDLQLGGDQDAHPPGVAALSGARGRSGRVAVVGAGVVGLSTAAALSDRGVDVTVIERGVPGAGQSGGRGRIFRHAHDDPRLAAIAADSLRRWRTWEERFGVELVAPVGALVVGAASARRLAALAALDEVTAEGIAGRTVPRFLPISAGYDGPALIDHTAGAIRTTAAVGALVGLLGDRLVSDEVHAVAPRPRGGVDVVTGGGITTVDRVVVCAGRGTAPLANQIGVALPIALEAHLRCTFAVRAPGRSLACLQDGTGQYGETGAYGTPQPGGRTYAVGLTSPIDVTADGAVADPQAFARVRRATSDYVARALPGLDPTPVGSRSCWITRLPWGEDALAVWRSGDVHVVAGHNLFKLAPWLGAVIADAVADDVECEHLRPDAELGTPAA